MTLRQIASGDATALTTAIGHHLSNSLLFQKTIALSHFFSQFQVYFDQIQKTPHTLTLVFLAQSSFTFNERFVIRVHYFRPADILGDHNSTNVSSC